MSVEEPTEKITVTLNTDLLERLRNAAYARGEKLAHIFTRGMRIQLRAMEHSNGQKYKPRKEALQVGRPRTITAVFVALLVGWGVSACSGTSQTVMQIPGDGGKAVFTKDTEGRIISATLPDPHYKVLTRMSVEAWSVSQISYQVVEHCSDRYTSEEMAVLRQQSREAFVSPYTKCRQIEKPTLTTEPGKWGYFKEMVAAGLIAGGLAYGLSSMDFGGDTTIANGGYGGAGGMGGAGGRGYGGTANAYGGAAKLNVRGYRW